MAITDLDLSNVITSSRQIDLTALGHIFDALSPQIYRYILFRLGDEVETQEMVIEVFNRLLQTLKHRPKSIDDPQTWLFEITRKLVEQLLSGADKSSPGRLAEQTDQTGAAQGIGQDETAWLGLLVRQSMHKLLPDQQHLLALRFAGRYAPDEIARIMEKSINDVKGLQLDALMSLRSQLEREA